MKMTQPNFEENHEVPYLGNTIFAWSNLADSLADPCVPYASIYLPKPHIYYNAHILMHGAYLRPFWDNIDISSSFLVLTLYI